MTNKRLQNSYSSSVQVKYLSKIHTRWISNHCAISLSVPSIFNKLRVPHTEVFIWFFPLWKNSDSWPQIPAICRVLQMCLQSLKHLSRGSHVTSIKNLMRIKKKGFNSRMKDQTRVGGIPPISTTKGKGKLDSSLCRPLLQGQRTG